MVLAKDAKVIAKFPKRQSMSMANTFLRSLRGISPHILVLAKHIILRLRMVVINVDTFLRSLLEMSPQILVLAKHAKVIAKIPKSWDLKSLIYNVLLSLRGMSPHIWFSQSTNPGGLKSFYALCNEMSPRNFEISQRTLK